MREYPVVLWWTYAKPSTSRPHRVPKSGFSAPSGVCPGSSPRSPGLTLTGPFGVIFISTVPPFLEASGLLARIALVSLTAPGLPLL